MDILVLLKDFVINFVYNLPEGLTSYVLRVGFLLALSCTVLFTALVHLPWRAVFIQACVALSTITLSLYMPLELCRKLGKEGFTFFILIAIFCMIFLPGKLSFCLTPRLGNQLRLRRVIVCLIWTGLIIQIIARR